MKRTWAMLLAVATISTANAQIIINEVHGFGSGSVPALPGDYLELWNQSGTNYDLSGHTIGIWAGDTGSVSSVTIPCNNFGRHIIPANGFWIFQEVGVVGDALTGTLAGLQGMRGLPATWASSSNMGCRVIDPLGNCIAYVYLRRGTTALPALPPNLVAPCTWTLGNISTVTSGQGHIQRLTNTNTDSFANWGQDPTANAGTPGAPNTLAPATQTPTGPVGAVGGLIPWETNSAACAFDYNGATSTGTGPIDVSICLNGTANANFASTNVGLPWDVGVGLALGLAGASACGPTAGGINTANGQVVNLDFADGSLFFLNNLTFTTLFPGAFAIPVPTASLLPNLSAQMVIIDPSNADGVALSALGQLHINNFETRTLTLTDDSTTNVVFSTFCGGPAGLNFFGATFTNFNVNSNGRVMFGGGDTDLSPTLAEALLDNPAVGLWTDLNPAPIGSGPITVSTVGGLVTVRWNGTYYFGTTTPVNFSVVFDPATSNVDIVLNSVPANPAGLGGGDAQMLGISGGAANLATLGANINFATGVGGSGALPTDMLVDFWDGLVANAPGGINRVASIGTCAGVRFIPSGATYAFLGL